MGRLAGIPYFFSYQSYSNQTADNKTLRKAKTSMAREDDERDPDVDLLKDAQVEISLRLRNRFENRVIRRVGSSKDSNGKPLISLPPLTIIPGVLDLSEREKELLEDITVEGISRYGRFHPQVSSHDENLLNC